MNTPLFTVVYPQKMSFSQYDGTHYLVYLNEAPAQYKPDEESEAVSGFSYTGNMRDGGTLIECDALERSKLINGIIRTRFMQTEEDAIKTHQIQLLQAHSGIEACTVSTEKESEYAEEWAAFQRFREMAIALVNSWLDEEEV